METIALSFMVAVAIGGAAWVFIYPLLSGERHVEKRKELVVRAGPGGVAAGSRTLSKSRREQVEGSLKELDERRAKPRSVPLSVQIAQAGLTWSKRRFILTSAGLGAFGFLTTLGINAGIFPAVAIGFAFALGLPRWMLKFFKRRREGKFLAALPDAVDIIVRGIKSGLPLLDSLKIITTDAPEPLRSEFRTIIETQTIGMPLGEACARLYDRVPVAEANFFGIVISIQQKAGGNLSEALGNLSRVLRDRKKMKGKIQAMSMEAKASAMIIAALPVTVMLLVYLTSPNYIELLWTHPMGRMMMAGCAFWMTMGVLVMRKMINFDF
jgi:tight adherence protein B